MDKPMPRSRFYKRIEDVGGLVVLTGVVARWGWAK
jgi:hypothetical protein